MALAAAACGTEPSDGANGQGQPQLGRYGFTATWPISGSATPASAAGTLTITSAVGDNIAYSFVLDEQGGPLGRADGADFVAGSGYIVISAPIQRSGPYQLFPHLNRSGANYFCSGSALNIATLQGIPLTCSWTFLGP
jgi:hypothetical protein